MASKLIREPNEVAKIVQDKESNALNEIGADITTTTSTNLKSSDHNINYEIGMCLGNGSYAGPYQFAAASLVCKARVNMVYPPVNGKSDPILGGLFCKEEWINDPSIPEIHILWNEYNSDACITSNKTFLPNHFNPMLKNVIFEKEEQPLEQEEQPLGQEEQPLEQEEQPFEQEEQPLEQNTDDIIENPTTDVKENKDVIARNDFPNTLNEVFLILQGQTIIPLDYVPLGNKINKQYVILHENYQNFLDSENFHHPKDDKSSYLSEGCPVRSYVYNIKNGRVVMDTKLKLEKTKIINKKTKEELSPELMANKVAIKTITQINKDQPKLRRRSTYVVIAPDNLNYLYNHCYIEYAGLDKNEGSSMSEHGNARTKPDQQKKPFHRSNFKVLNSARVHVVHNEKNSKNYLLHLNPSNPHESIRNSRVIANLKAQHRREVLGIRGNTCDDVIKILTKMHYKKENSIRKTFGDTDRGELPSVAAWRDWHMKTIPNLCRWDTLAVVLGQDITFNLVCTKYFII